MATSTFLTKNTHLLGRCALLLVFVLSFAALSVAQSSRGCRDKDSQLGSLILAEPTDSQKVPLILIHGINGTKASDDVTKLQGYWNSLLSQINSADGSRIRSLYSLYVFQYCSNKRSVKDIADTLRKAVEDKLKGRRHVIVAHSMGGLVAKSYMAETTQLIGGRQQPSGENVIGLITLATPHHGTPGANDVEALTPLVTPLTIAGLRFPHPIIKQKLRWLNTLYWNKDKFKSIWQSIKEKCKGVSSSNPIDQRVCFVQGLASSDILSISESSTNYNRGDLRWDSFDSLIEGDKNQWLSDLNLKFKAFADKTIVYAGALKPQPPDILVVFHQSVLDDSALASFADGMLHFGLDKRFGYTDGLVPYKSAMFCDHDPRSTSEMSCSSRFRVRRFEFGDPRTSVDMQSGRTLSIVRTLGGFDHREMYEHGFILTKVIEDLNNFAVRTPNPERDDEFPAPAVEPIPTLFLLDVSGSMESNNKIGQARAAGLAAVSEMLKNRRMGRDASAVSISVFGGDCDSRSPRVILPFTNDLNSAESTFRSRIPKPSGATPLHLSIGRSVAQMRSMIASNGTVNEGRIIVLSDGEDTCNEPIRPRGVYGTGHQNSQSIKYMTIGFDVPPGSKAERDLQYLASISGGSYFPANDARQLASAFAKTIRIFVPKDRSTATADFKRGVAALSQRDYTVALQIWTAYVQNNPNDVLGVYNLALTCEAMKLYKTAGQFYRRYSTISNGSDRSVIEEKIAEMQQEYVDQLDYYLQLIESDIGYIEAYYRSIFNRTSTDLAAEFSGFVNEKAPFYGSLPVVIESNIQWLLNDCKDVSASINVLARRTRMNTFDTDAVSLLTLPIAQLKDLLKRLKSSRSQLINSYS